MPAVIELENLEVRLGQRTILDQLNGSLSGRCIGLLGPNGSGKSTLINTLLGFYRPANGRARIFGKEVQGNLREIRDNGQVYLLISSHLLRDVEECCDEVIILKEGRIAAICNLEEARKANLKFLELEVSQENGFLESVKSLGCECASFGGGRLKVVLSDNIELRQLYRLAAEHSVQIRRMNYRRDSLEDIFLKAMSSGTPPPPPPPPPGSSNGRL